MATLESLHEKKAAFVLKSFKRGEPEKNRKELSFQLKPLKVYGNVLAAESIHANGHLIVFDGYEDTIQSDLWALEEDKAPLVYHDVSVMRGYDYNDEIHHFLIVRPVKQAKRMNKRGAFRVKVGIGCQILVHSSNETIPGQLRDVSTNGFAVDIRKEYINDNFIHDTFTIEFTDTHVSQKPISITGIVVRREDKESYMIWGCKVENESLDYAGYVMKKQAQKAKVRAMQENVPVELEME